MNEKIRLDKFISNQTGVSRSETKKLIKKGFAAVNGTAVKNAEFSVEPENDTVVFCGDTLSYKKYIYIMMNKPADVVSASRSPEERTVVDLVPDSMKRRGLFPAGRLDKDSTGFVLITDDGEFAHSVLSPSRHVPKTYLVTAETELSPENEKKFMSGVELSDGVTKPAKITKTEKYIDGHPVYEVVLFEGRYHQIKRMFSSLGSCVLGLHRISFGGLKLDESLLPGECRELGSEEVAEITKNR